MLELKGQAMPISTQVGDKRDRRQIIYKEIKKMSAVDKEMGARWELGKIKYLKK